MSELHDIKNVFFAPLRIKDEKTNRSNPFVSTHEVGRLIENWCKPEPKKMALKKIAASTKPPPQKRVVTLTTQWKVKDPLELTTGFQLAAIRDMVANAAAKGDGTAALVHTFLRQQIHQKIYGYKSQDLAKGLFVEADFVDVDSVLCKMVECENLCYYCKKPVQVLYEYVREPKQWTLERLDNAFGHTVSNVVIACLHCNLRRRTMYHERYLFTKELSIKKMD